MRVRVIPVVLALLALSGCAEASYDRVGEAGGKDPDIMADASHVTVYRNADAVPNVAIFCTGDLRWAATLSGDRKGAMIVRLPEQDAICTGAPR